MPYIKTTANVAIASAKMDAIKSQLGKDVSLLGKSESWLMVDFCENSPLFFKGTREPAAMVSVDLYGAAGADAYTKMTGAITKLLVAELGISADRIFVKYQAYENWGWSGNNF